MNFFTQYAHIPALAIVIARMIKGGGSFSLGMMISKKQLS